MPIKLLHLADLHLGYRAYERWEEGRPVRLGEFLAALDAALDVGFRAGVDAVIVAGDVYDSARAEPLVQREWARRVTRVREAGVPLVVITGNHDRPHRAPAVSGQAVFDALSLPGVFVVSSPALLEIATAGGSLTIAAAPWSFSGTRAAVLAAEENIRRLIHEDWAPRLEAAEAAILAGHLWLRGGTLTSEGSTLFDESQLEPAAVAHAAFKYYALGHLHRHQALAMPEGGPAVYAGAPARLSFEDEGVPKGAVVVELGPDGAAWRFAEIPSRDFVTIDLAAEDQDSLAAAVEKAASRDVAGAVVRLNILGPAELAAQIQARELEAAFSRAYYVRVVFTPRRAERRRVGIAPESSPADALAQYAADRPPPAGVTADELLARARALEGRAALKK